MTQYKIIMAIVVLIASLFFLFDQLFTPVPIQIILETGIEVTTATAEYFSLVTVLVLISSSFLIGSLSVVLFYSSNTKEVIRSLRKQERPEKRYEMVLPLLKGDERPVFIQLLKAGGQALQNKLVLDSGLSKVKITRVLNSLERKHLIIKERHGLTNKIKLREPPQADQE